MLFNAQYSIVYYLIYTAYGNKITNIVQSDWFHLHSKISTGFKISRHLCNHRLKSLRYLADGHDHKLLGQLSQKHQASMQLVGTIFYL